MHPPRASPWAMRKLWALSSLLALLSFGRGGASPKEGDITCNQSGMCSVGKNKYYFGTVTTGEGLREALESVSYKKEIIIVTTAGSRYLEFLYQLHNQFRRLGMAHFLALSMAKSGCDEVAAISGGQKNVSCGWDSSTQHARSWGGGPLLWHLRWRFIARASRLGYDIMSLDSDYMILQDPYVFLKAPPMSDATILAVAEHTCGMNGGFAYIQNAAPDGPATWVYHRTTEIPLRWMDDDFAFLMSLGKQKKNEGMCMSFDQSFLDDSLHSTLSGKMIFKNMISSCTNEDWKSSTGMTKAAVMTKQSAITRCVESFTDGATFKPPSSWPKKPDLDPDFFQFRSGTMRVPNDGADPDPPALGGAHFSRAGGVYSGAYFQQLKDDCLNASACPMWKDSKAEDAATARDTTAQLSFVPKWFAASAADLAHGFLTPTDGSRPRQVMFHFHVLAFVRNEWKGAVNKIYGGFDWKLSKLLHSNKEAAKGLMPGPYLTGNAPKRMLAIHPSLDLSKTNTQREFKRITAGLVQLAILSGRTVVFPDMPCSTSWVHKKADGAEACTDTTKLLRLHGEHMPYAARVEPHEPSNLKKEYRICSAFLADRGCLGPNNAVSGMLSVEFEEWVAHDAPEGTNKAPSSSNTIFGGASIFGNSIVMLKEDEVKAELAKYDNEPLLYVGHMVVVDPSGALKQDSGWLAKFNSTLQECRGLYYTPYLLDKLGAAKVEDYAFGPAVSVKEVSAGATPASTASTPSSSSSSSSSSSVASSTPQSNGSGAESTAPEGVSGGERAELNKYSVLLNSNA